MGRIYSDNYSEKDLFDLGEIKDYFDFIKRIANGDTEPALEYAQSYLVYKQNNLEQLYSNIYKEPSLDEKDKELFNKVYNNLGLFYKMEAESLSDELLIKYLDRMKGINDISPYFKIRLEKFSEEKNKRELI